jgi:hypothetical protein
MGLYLAVIAGLVVWIVGWALGIKSFDAFLITLAIVLVAVTARILSPFLPGNQATDDEEPPGGHWTPR